MGRSTIAVCDIDGVLADVRHRLHHVRSRPKDWDAFFAEAVRDEAHREGAELLAALSEQHDVVLLTGRPERTRADTVTWLQEHGMGGHELLMRPEGDRRPAAQVKLEALHRLARRADVAVVVDDDERVVAAARAAGFNVHHARWEARAGEEQRALLEAQEVEGRS